MLHFATVSGASSNSGNGAALHAMPRIHAMVNQTVAKTGRLSMEAPNLQTVPKPFTFSVSSSSLAEGRSHLGGGAGSGDGGAGGGDEGTTTTTTTTTYVCSLRRSITPPPGMVLIAADYKQLELRMMAHLSGDPQLLALLHDTRIDPFIQLAAKWLNKPSVSAVTPEDRGRAKNLCYALLYGMGKAKLAQDFGLKGPTAEREAENLKNSFLDAFPGLKQWIQRVHMAISNTNNVTTSSGFVSGVVAGEIRTLFGRLRRFPKGSGSGGGGSGHGGNVGNKALNSLTQGSAADVSKRGMLAVARAIDKLNKASNGGGGSSEGMMVARLVLSIHDEFLVEVDCRHVHRVAMELRNAMEGVVPWLSVPLPVKISIGRSSWGEMEEL
jgi:DNA polymerase theta